MKDINSQQLYFSTYTNLNWIHVLQSDQYKNIIIDSLKFLINEKRIQLYGFVIMPNHIHLTWLICEGHLLKNVQRDFLKFTAQNIKFNMIENKDVLLDQLLIRAKDRTYQFWERNGYSFLLNRIETIEQKLNYIHLNPVREKWKLCGLPSEYKYSSASFYETGIDAFEMLSHIKNEI